jgi:hypothetical protein
MMSRPATWTRPDPGATIAFARPVGSQVSTWTGSLGMPVDQCQNARPEHYRGEHASGPNRRIRSLQIAARIGCWNSERAGRTLPVARNRRSVAFCRQVPPYHAGFWRPDPSPRCRTATARPRLLYQAGDRTRVTRITALQPAFGGTPSGKVGRAIWDPWPG